ncbi:MAG: cupin domain-containing protein [Patescibacteria group bacterium]
MLIKHLSACPEFIAGDKTLLRELLHPANDKTAIRYSLAHSIVKAGNSSVAHSLKTTEVYYILEGTGIMHINDETAAVAPGDAVYIPPNAVQYIENTGTGDLKFLCVVDPAWRKEDENITQ